MNSLTSIFIITSVVMLTSCTNECGDIPSDICNEIQTISCSSIDENDCKTAKGWLLAKLKSAQANDKAYGTSETLSLLLLSNHIGKSDSDKKDIVAREFEKNCTQENWDIQKCKDVTHSLMRAYKTNSR